MSHCRILICCFLFILPLEGVLPDFQMTTSLGHKEGKGLGYSRGYTSLDIFLFKPCREFTPFVDLRAHAFNHGGWASNAGIGIRYFSPNVNKFLGFYIFCDSLNLKHIPYHQISIGLEVLGDVWSYRANGYLPVGRKKTQIFTLDYDFSSGFEAIAKEEFAMAGVDAEVEYHFSNFKNVDLYTALGPYFYHGRSRSTTNAFKKTDKEFVGARLRATALFLNFCQFEAIVSYDPRFNMCAQIAFSINISFSRSCDSLPKRVVRNEIMVINKVTRRSTNPEILDPEFEP